MKNTVDKFDEAANKESITRKDALYSDLNKEFELFTQEKTFTYINFWDVIALKKTI